MKWKAKKNLAFVLGFPAFLFETQHFMNHRLHLLCYIQKRHDHEEQHRNRSRTRHYGVKDVKKESDDEFEGC